MKQIKWTKEYNCDETMINGFRVTRHKWSSGTRYYVHWFECAHYAAHHSRMSISPHRSLKSVRGLIAFLESQPMKYFNLPRLRQVKASLKRIDNKYPDFGDKWHELYKRYTRQFRKHDEFYQRTKGA